MPEIFPTFFRTGHSQTNQVNRSQHNIILSVNVNFEFDKREKMAKFIKDGLQSNTEKELRIEISNEDILSPYYFPLPEDQMRQREVAEMFSTTVQTIINWSSSGKIPSFRIGKVPIYSLNFLFILPETIEIS